MNGDAIGDYCSLDRSVSKKAHGSSVVRSVVEPVSTIYSANRQISLIFSSGERSKNEANISDARAVYSEIGICLS